MDAFRTFLKKRNITLPQAAKALGRSHSALKKWGQSRPYPSDVLPAIERYTDGEVPGSVLRPDLYEPLSHQEAA